MTIPRKFPILVADDDPEDRLLVKEALEESCVANEIHFVNDGEQLLSYLKTCEIKPGLILLDLNMPRMDGREALREIKNNPELKRIPVIILTTSKAEEDIYRTYDLGVNSFVTKPVTFSALVDVVRNIGHYWFEIVELPGRKRT